ncbi:MAG: hypothetical protein JWP15_513 [Alphaproteobacteria bacterium]|nr:hypothetical protein [Alphaproteobacteria bacterium]
MFSINCERFGEQVGAWVRPRDALEADEISSNRATVAWPTMAALARSSVRQRYLQGQWLGLTQVC